MTRPVTPAGWSRATQSAPHRTLCHGPYASPAVRIGQRVECAMHGPVVVHSMRLSGQVVWPWGTRPGLRSSGRPGLLVIGSLVTALRTESAVAVAAHWGVSAQQVRRWRRAIGVGRMTPGSRALAVELGRPDIGAQSPKGTAASLAPAVRRRRDQRHAATMRGKPDIAQHMREIGLRGGAARGAQVRASRDAEDRRPGD